MQRIDIERLHELHEQVAMGAMLPRQCGKTFLIYNYIVGYCMVGYDVHVVLPNMQRLPEAKMIITQLAKYYDVVCEIHYHHIIFDGMKITFSPDRDCYLRGMPKNTIIVRGE